MTSKNMMRKGLQRGLSLVELMIAMVIGLVVMIVVYQMFVVSEGTRRTSVAGNDAQMSAAIAIGALQDTIRNGGYGLTGFDLANGVAPMGCDVKGYRAGIGAFINFQLIPVTVGQGADNNVATGVGKDSDSITVVYSDLAYPTVPVNLLSGMGSTTGDVLVTNRFSINPGDVLVLADVASKADPKVPRANAADTGAGIVCALTEATATPTLPAGPTILATVRHLQGTYVDNTGQNRLVRFNGPAGIGASAANAAGMLFQPTASVYNLGPNPSVITFSVNQANNQLMRSDLLANTTMALVDGVVALQAQYGVGLDLRDANGNLGPPFDGFADTFNPSGGQGSWQNPAVAPPPGLVVAVRLAVLTRGNLIEAKDKTTGLCNATAAASPELVWAGGSFDVTGTVDWDCYRYKKFEAVVPLRNIIWMPS
jgi:type IV pilus assembly protein PilW